MLLGIDASRAVVKNKTGVEWYSYFLLKEMGKQIPDGWRIKLYVPKMEPNNESERILRIMNSSWSIKELRWPPRRFWTQARLSWEMFRRPPDVLFVPSHVLPLIHPKKSVVTIHDLGFERFPECYKFFDRVYQRWSTKFALKHATKIIAPSEFTKKELVELYKADSEKIVVIPHGVVHSLVDSPSPGLRPPSPGTAPARPVFDPHGRGEGEGQGGARKKDYFLFIGRLEKKKNIERLIEAWKRARLNDYELILVGNGYLGNVPEGVRLLGWRSREECRQLLRDAAAYIMPSLYEGFGLTLLEAMAAGVPVVCSDIPSHREVAGEAALFVNPLSVEAISEGIRKIADDDNRRNELARKGSERVKGFSWTKTAQKTWQLVQELVK